MREIIRKGDLVGAAEVKRAGIVTKEEGGNPKMIYFVHLIGDSGHTTWFNTHLKIISKHRRKDEPKTADDR